MAVEKWVAGNGQGLTWGNAFSQFGSNHVPPNDSLLSDIQIDNSVALDMFADVSLSWATVSNTGTLNTIGIYIYPLNQDGTTYGDGKLTAGTAVATLATVDYMVGDIITSTQASNIEPGILRMIPLPPAKFRFAIVNNSLTSADFCNILYRTYNRVLV